MSGSSGDVADHVWLSLSAGAPGAHQLNWEVVPFGPAEPVSSSAPRFCSESFMSFRLEPVSSLCCRAVFKLLFQVLRTTGR